MSDPSPSSSAWIAVPFDEYMPTREMSIDADTVALPLMLIRDFVNASGAPAGGRMMMLSRDTLPPLILIRWLFRIVSSCMSSSNVIVVIVNSPDIENTAEGVAVPSSSLLTAETSFDACPYGQ